MNFPTFCKNPAMQLANVIVAKAPLKDPSEEYIHDNDVIDWICKKISIYYIFYACVGFFYFCMK